MWWIIIISVIVIAGLAFWMMSDKNEESEVSDTPEDSAVSAEEPIEEDIEENTEESPEEEKPEI